MNAPYWIKHSNLFSPETYECSNCKAVKKQPTRFCPDCGRQMKGVKDSPDWVDELEAFDAFLD